MMVAVVFFLRASDREATAVATFSSVSLQVGLARQVILSPKLLMGTTVLAR